MTKMAEQPLSPGPDSPTAAIIVAEHNYIAQTAFQANEDRARASQYFFVTFATLVAAVLSSQVSVTNPTPLYIAFTIIFGLLSILGLVTLLQLVRLRQAWLESIGAMNQIKARMMQDHPELAGYFRWTHASTPPAFKAGSFGFLQAVSVSLLSGLALGAAVAFGGLATGQSTPWMVAVAIGFAGAAVFLGLGYVRPLRQTFV